MNLLKQNTKQNKYLTKYGYYSYLSKTDNYSLTLMRIIKPIDENNEELKNYYLVKLVYSHILEPETKDMHINEELEGFDHVIIELNKEKMENNEKYSKFVLGTLLNKNRISDLCKIEMDKKQENKNGIYVGTVLDKKFKYEIYMNEKNGTYIENLEETKKTKEKYKKIMEENSLYNNYKQAKTKEERKRIMKLLKQVLLKQIEEQKEQQKINTKHKKSIKF